MPLGGKSAAIHLQEPIRNLGLSRRYQTYMDSPLSSISDITSDEVETRHSKHEPVRALSRLRKLPPGPFRSLGKHLNYAQWEDCRRFMELDRAIQFEDSYELQGPERTRLVA
jgi:hypothetical protein